MKKIAVFFLVALACFLLAPSGEAQVAAGITGNVTDTTGAVLPGVSITAENTDTSLSRTSVSNESGNYNFPAMPIGNYRMSAELPGFSVAVRSDILLQTGDTLRVNFALEVGQVTDTITVTEEAPVIQSESAELGTVINNKTVLEVPLNGREFYALLKLVPGTVSPAPNSGLAHRGGVSVAGARETSNAYTIDGIDNGSAGTNGPQIKIGVETLQEFKLLTNSYSPEYGRGGGGQVVMTTRSGTNEYRGTVWNFLRNDAMDAKNFFDSRPEPPPLRRNQFGFVFGGPVGSLENLHFFTGFEGLRNRKSLTSGATVPDAAWHDGDFSSLLPGTVINDPLTGDPFPGNIIPEDRWDPIGKEFVDYYPDPTNSNRSRNLITNPSQDRDNDQATLRLDYSFGAHNIYARHIYNRELIAEAFQGRGGENGVPGFGWFNTLVGNTFSVGGTFIYSPSLIGTVRYGVTTMWEPVISKNLAPNGNPFVQGDPNAVLDEGKGWTRRDMQIRPRVTASGFGRVGDRSSPSGRQEYINEFNYTQRFLTGNHEFTAGYNHRVIMIDHFLPGNAAGRFDFRGNHSGHPIADMLLGFPRESRITPTIAKFRTHQRGQSYSTFFNDDWKVTPTLTVNLGVRWEINTPMYDSNNVSIHSFNFDTAKVIVPDPSLLDPRALAPEFVEGSQFGKGLRPTDKNNFAPRIGMAYSVNDKTVIRAGYGMFTDNIAFGNHQTTLVFGPWALSKTFRTDSSTGPAVSLSNNPFPDEIFTNPLLSVSGWDPEATDGYVQNWNLTIQRELIPDVVLEAAYLGSHGDDLMTKLPVNNAVLPGPGLPSSTQARRPYPDWNSVTMLTNQTRSNFHALQFKLDKRFSGGLQLLGNYMWSKATDNNSTGNNDNLQNVFDLDGGNYGLSNYDTRHRFVTNFVYELPGPEFGAASYIAGGWQLSGILTLQAGRPVTARLNGDNSRTGASARPDQICDPNTGPETPNNFWNKACFVTPPRGTFGNAGRNTLIGPGMRQFDMSAAKQFAIDDVRYVQFRVEAFNIFNHPVFGQPSGRTNSSSFGVIQSTLVNTTARQIQLGLKVYF